MSDGVSTTQKAVNMLRSATQVNAFEARSERHITECMHQTGASHAGRDTHTTTNAPPPAATPPPAAKDCLRRGAKGSSAPACLRCAARPPVPGPPSPRPGWGTKIRDRTGAANKHMQADSGTRKR